MLAVRQRVAVAVMALVVPVSTAKAAHHHKPPEPSPQKQVVKVARKQLGDPYVWGAAGPNAFDCSGLIWYVYRKIGRFFPRETAAALERIGRRVYGRLHPGDIIVVHGGSHVVLYVGHGKVIHAPHTGDHVRYAPARRYLQAAVAIRRILPWRR